jgi:hypothetical protein
MNIPHKPWTKTKPPRRILAIRTQAMGDVMITLPYLQHLRRSLPASVQLDLLTREETDPVPKNIALFDNVYSIGGGRNLKKIFFLALLKLPRLLLQRYDVVIDLQNNNTAGSSERYTTPGMVRIRQILAHCRRRKDQADDRSDGPGKMRAGHLFSAEGRRRGARYFKKGGMEGVRIPGGFEPCRPECHPELAHTKLYRFRKAMAAA